MVDCPEIKNYKNFMRISPVQLRAARAALNWSLQDMATATGVHRNTIHNFERGKFNMQQENMDAIVEVLKKHGVTFTAKSVVMASI